MKNKCNKTPLVFRIYKIIIIILVLLLLSRYLYQNSSLFYKKSFDLPFTLNLNERDLYLVRGEEFRLYVWGNKKPVSYYSTNFRVADVNFNGRVYGYQPGKTFIIAKVDQKEIRCRVHVIDINKKEISLKTGKSYKLRIKGTNAYVNWKSSNKNIAKVNMFGKVKAVSPGTAIIYGKVKGKTLRCTVIVR